MSLAAMLDIRLTQPDKAQRVVVLGLRPAVEDIGTSAPPPPVLARVVPEQRGPNSQRQVQSSHRPVVTKPSSFLTLQG